jgi:hypothetical protein
MGELSKVCIEGERLAGCSLLNETEKRQERLLLYVCISSLFRVYEPS